VLPDLYRTPVSHLKFKGLSAVNKNQTGVQLTFEDGSISFIDKEDPLYALKEGDITHLLGDLRSYADKLIEAQDAQSLMRPIDKTVLLSSFGDQGINDYSKYFENEDLISSCPFSHFQEINAT